MFQSLRERLVLVLIALLPFHAFLVTFGTAITVGAGHAPLTVLALWKEALLGIILVIAFLEILLKRPATSDQRPVWRLDVLDMCIVALLMIALALFAFGHPASIAAFVFGFRYDFVPLVAFLLLRRVTWSDGFIDRALKTVLFVAVIIAGYGLIAVTLPQSFFTWLGYSDLHSLYLPGGPIAAFQQIGGTALRRTQSVMSGPNQLGLWLLLPLAIGLVRRKPMETLLILITLFATLSRSAVLASFAIITVLLWQRVPHKRLLQMAGVCLLIAACVAVVGGSFVSDVLIRKASSSDHIARPLAALHTMIAHPFGLGLAAAGPASNRISDACVFLEEGSDASWAADRPDLCVFVADKQVQPLDRTCTCPFLPENWYLQIGVEMGVVGMLLFIVLVCLVLWKLKAISDQRSAISNAVLFAFLGVSIAAVFLHAWEDSALSYTLWMLIAALLPIRR